jgi:CRP-like cAMP-binding protein
MEPHDVPTEVIFPGSGTVLGVLALFPDRKPVETALVGCEGAVGALFGPQTADSGMRIQVIGPGTLIRIPSDPFGEALAASPGLRAGMARYIAALLAQSQYATACTALYPVEARACRWMLTLQDRMGDRALPVTQETLADLLGVRRTTITRVVAALEERGLVRHRRGRIIVMDRAGLERASSPTHHLVRRRFEATAPGLYPAELPAAAE